ncbi:uncharacterized protein L3040_007341 [Drepanopeziza brunnea f. sp. 'multigermtubi']|uniref:uncharacterized protein n=1 Tax=Drepanopeziza brunnea f. sp. 'multigermtubi' TaxID=698441 RepID=UPI00238B8EC4|nr:hypothetical protein L3040_007341 [Drepanopeziza brunnea f. sp. 'multigermtubi']
MLRTADKTELTAKCLATQAALPEQERIDAPTRDWDALVYPQLSDSQESLIANLKQTFIDFLSNEDLPIKLSPDDAANYFKRGGTVVTTKLLRMFLEYMAQSRTGLHPRARGALNIQTVHAYVDTLGVAFQRVQNPIDKEITAAAHAWIEVYRLPRGMVARYT